VVRSRSKAEQNYTVINLSLALTFLCIFLPQYGNTESLRKKNPEVNGFL
jgi:hypothetical protein